jgi:hypothetical protein
MEEGEAVSGIRKGISIKQRASTVSPVIQAIRNIILPKGIPSSRQYERI